MDILDSQFIKSSEKLDQLPKPDRPEYAFIGRSNVGKSSLINMLTGRKSLAKISGTPGKTRQINHFLINADKLGRGGWYLADLPGMGYAKVGKQQRASFKGMVYSYLEKRENLMCVFTLLDSRLKPQQIDLDLMDWLGRKRIPFVMVFTKIDKLSSSELGKNLKVYKQKMLQGWTQLPPIFITSSNSLHGKLELLNFIEETNLLFQSGD